MWTSFVSMKFVWIEQVGAAERGLEVGNSLGRVKSGGQRVLD